MIIIKLACMILFLLTGFACGYEPITIKGEVVDESGAPLINVNICACYSGWGLSNSQIVWDKDYCSETVQTNHEGLYVITFKGPVSSKMRAWKEGWVQTQDYNTTQTRIVLIRSEDYNSTVKAEAMKLRNKHRQFLSGESGRSYYCRVIMPEVRSINLNYQDEILSITPALLEDRHQEETIFSVRGSTRTFRSFFDEVVIKINDENFDINVSFKSTEKNCGPDIHFISVKTSGLNSLQDARVEILIPSINAMFDMQIWEN